MCGIAGVIGGFCGNNLIENMIALMNHRGPDASGFFNDHGVRLGHCRLAINDLSESASQPFISKDNKTSAAINGEIYNYFELKRELERKGHLFQSDSDSEVVLHGYIEYGLDFFKRLNGMFAIAIWDGKTKELFLIRDRLGIKPIYYAKVRDTFIFASEVKALAKYEHLHFDVDLQSFAEYLAFENCFSNRTLGKNVKLVRPGEMVTFSGTNRSVTQKKIWRPAFGNRKTFDGDIYAEYREIIYASVKRHLVSDVPLGFYLSSGIDSSSVVCCASNEISAGLRTYTGYFGMSGFYDESDEASKIAGYFGCRNERVKITPLDFIENIEKVLWHLDEPKVGMGSFSQYMVAKYASKDVKVILTGHGGDEFFAGYPVFKTIYGRNNITKLLMNSSFRELMFIVYFNFFPLLKKETGYFLPNIYSLKLMKNILKSDFYDLLTKKVDIFKELDNLKRNTRNEYERLTMTYLKLYLPALFIVEDKISMAFSLESRTPLCDNEMLDFALSVPLSQKLLNFELKHIPRTAMKGQLPDRIYNLPKRGFPTPLLYWFKNELRDYIKSFILDNISVINMFNKEEVEKMITAYQRSKCNTPYNEITAHRIWVLMNLIVYFTHLENRYGSR